jgi:hypothetical protein
MVSKYNIFVWSSHKGRSLLINCEVTCRIFGGREDRATSCKEFSLPFLEKFLKFDRKNNLIWAENL